MRYRTWLLLAALLTCWTAESLADPPPHAPAHGWRKKHDPYYVGYSGTTWERDYEVTSGRCNREQIGAVLGGVAGAVVGSRVASPENRTVGTIVGAAVGALLGSRIGRELDDRDRACFGHVLEIAPPGGRVAWENPATGVAYVLVPGEGRKQGASMCRNFTLIASAGGRESRRAGSACQSSRGVWNIT
jgi:surface antigen